MAVQTDRMKELLRDKARMEDSIEAYTEFLLEHGKEGSSGLGAVGLAGNIIDAEGFPRADIDLYQVREARNKIAVMQNDHKHVMKQVEEELFQAHERTADAPIRVQRSTAAGGASASSSGGVAGDGAQTSGGGGKLALAGPPFASIDQVAAGSPAETAGLQEGDKVRRLGTLQLSSGVEVQDIFKNLRTQVVSGQAVQVVVERQGGSEHTLTLTPQPWEGQGLLGCHLTPFSA